MTVNLGERIGARFLDRGGAVFNVRHPDFGAAGDGVADDTGAIQAAILEAGSAGGVVLIPPGKYRVTDEIVLRDKVALVGAGGFDRSPSRQDAWLWWDGPEAPDKAILKCSTVRVGMEPQRALSNVRVQNLVLDGQGRIGYGLYVAYCTNDSRFENITSVLTTRHGMWFGKLWYARLFGLAARRNRGCGITIGERPSGWSRSSLVNAVFIADLRAHENGTDRAYNEINNPEWGYGIGFFPGNACILRGAVSEKNYGPGVLFRLGSGAVNGIYGLYLESNGERAVENGDATRNWGLVVRGSPNARGNFVEAVYLGGSVNQNPQSIWLTGREPHGTLILKNIAFGQYLRADWSNYAFEDSVYYGITDYITGHTPRSDVKVAPRGISTLFVRAGGSNAQDGRSASTAFATLGKAVAVAAMLSRVSRIDCTGAALGEESLHVGEFVRGRSLVIDGGGSATADAITIRGTGGSVTIQGFASIGRVQAVDCPVPLRLRQNVIALDGEDDSAVTAIRAHIHLERCILDGSGSRASHRCAVVACEQSEVVLEATVLKAFSHGRYYRLGTGSQIQHDVDDYQDDALFEDGTATLQTPARIRSVAGSITFQ